MPSFWDVLLGSNPKMKSTLSKPQQGMMNQFMQGGGIEGNQLYGQGSNFLQSLLSNDPQSFQHFEAPFMQNFNENIAPGIAERFAGMGTGASGLSSSGFQNSLSQAGRSLQTDLAGLRGGLQMQGLGQGLNYAQQPYSNMLGGMNVNSTAMQPGSSGLLQELLKAFAQALPGMM